MGQATAELSHDAAGIPLCGAEWDEQAAPLELPPDTPCAGETAALRIGDLLLDEATLVNSRVLPYALMVASLLERRPISREELLAALQAPVRQRSIGRQARREYVLRYLDQHPP